MRALEDLHDATFAPVIRAVEPWAAPALARLEQALGQDPLPLLFVAFGLGVLTLAHRLAR